MIRTTLAVIDELGPAGAFGAFLALFALCLVVLHGIVVLIQNHRTWRNALALSRERRERANA